MKRKYGTEVKLSAPLYTPAGMAEWIGWGTKWNAKDINITDYPIYSKKFYDEIAFKIQPE